MNKYAVTYKQDGIETPQFIYTESEAAREMLSYHGTASLEMTVIDENGDIYEAGQDGPDSFFLNQLNFF